jgi:hypothetical protein
MSRFVDMAGELARMLADAERHGDIAQRRAACVSARRLLQQFTAAGNVAIEGLENSIDERPQRLPYRDD